MLLFWIWDACLCRPIMNMRAGTKVNSNSLQLSPTNPHFTVKNNFYKIKKKVLSANKF